MPINLAGTLKSKKVNVSPSRSPINWSKRFAQRPHTKTKGERLCLQSTTLTTPSWRPCYLSQASTRDQMRFGQTDLKLKSYCKKQNICRFPNFLKALKAQLTSPPQTLPAPVLVFHKRNRCVHCKDWRGGHRLILSCQHLSSNWAYVLNLHDAAKFAIAIHELSGVK